MLEGRPGLEAAAARWWRCAVAQPRLTAQPRWDREEGRKGEARSNNLLPCLTISHRVLAIYMAPNKSANNPNL